MIVLGIDPGLQITGYGAVRIDDGEIEPKLIEAGIIRLDRTQPLEQRLGQLDVDLTELIARIAPRYMAVEKLFAHYAHPRTAILMGHARGVILLAAQRGQMEIEHLSATEVKKAITGHGHASKEQVQRAVQSQCHLDEIPKPPDVADAIAIALTGARRLAVRRLA